MTRIPVGYTELIKAFRKHTREMDRCTGSSRHLLFFYAIECGLKYLLVRYRQCLRTDQLKEHHAHDIRELLKALRAPRSVINRVPRHFHLKRDKQECYATGEAHQAWRYGVKIRVSDEKTLITCLDQVRGWIERKV